LAQGEAWQTDEGPPVAPAARADLDALARVALARTPTPMFIADATAADRPIVLANAAFLDLTGYTTGEALGRSCLPLEREGEAAGESLRAALSRAELSQIEFELCRRDGSCLWTSAHVSPIGDAAGAPRYYVCSLADVTERHEARAFREAERRLLREVDHRAMNALALVQGFVRLSRRDSIEQFARSVQDRVEVLARTHVLLARTRWADVTLDQLLRMELAAADPERVELEGQEVLVSAERVQPLALLLHELASNAALHGALSEPEGRLEVTWRRGRTPDVVTLSWRERGVRRPTSHQPGFGLRLVSSIARQQLRGRARQHWRDDGLATYLSCRIAAAA